MFDMYQYERVDNTLHCGHGRHASVVRVLTTDRFRFTLCADGFIKSLLFWNFLIYPTISRTVLGYFNCDAQAGPVPACRRCAKALLSRLVLPVFPLFCPIRPSSFYLRDLTASTLSAAGEKGEERDVYRDCSAYVCDRIGKRDRIANNSRYNPAACSRHRRVAATHDGCGRRPRPAQVDRLKTDYRQTCPGTTVSGGLLALPFILIYPFGILLLILSFLIW